MEKEEKKVDEKMRSCSKLLMTLMMVCVLLSIATLGIVVYDKFINNEERLEHAVLKPIDGKCEVPNNTSQNNGVSVNSLKSFELTNTNQIVKIGNKELKIRKGMNNGNEVLYINDEIARTKYNEIVLARFETFYVTDKFVFFTAAGQNGQYIGYAVDENGKEIVVNTNGYQLFNINLNNNNLFAKGISGEIGINEDVNEVNVMVKYIDHTLIVIKSN